LIQYTPVSFHGEDDDEAADSGGTIASEKDIQVPFWTLFATAATNSGIMWKSWNRLENPCPVDKASNIINNSFCLHKISGKKTKSSYVWPQPPSKV
jgi:hypothetical protein